MSHLGAASLDQVPKQLPFITIESHHAHPLNGSVIFRASVDRDPRQKHPEFQFVKARRLLHDVVMREIVATALEHLDKGLSREIPHYCLAVSAAGRRKIAIHEI